MATIRVLLFSLYFEDSFMTTDLRTRVWEHQKRINPSSFTARYNVVKPIYYKGFDAEEGALEREQYIKGKSRKWKEALIAVMNPEWNDLTDVIMDMNP